MEINGTVNPPQVSSEGIPRRKFLVMATAVAIFLALVEGLRITLAFLKPQKTEGFGSVFFPGTVSDFPPGSVSHVRKGRFYLIHGDDGLIAIYQQCTHLGCLVPWNEEEQIFACPCHAGQYNPVGEVVSGPPPRPLDLFQLEVIRGEIAVDTGKVIQRERYQPSQAVKA